LLIIVLAVVELIVCLNVFCSLLDESFQELISLQRALKEFVASADPVYSKQHEDFFIGFVGR